jgi:hypothetical protein
MKSLVASCPTKLIWILLVLFVQITLWVTFYDNRNGLSFINIREDNVELNNLPQESDSQSNVVNYLRHVRLVDNLDGHLGTYNLKRHRKIDYVSDGSHSQPSYVLSFFKNKSHGTYVEFGAYDGEYTSNSLKLEIHNQWRGLLIEPVPALHVKLLDTNRRAMFLDVCVGTKPFPYEASVTLSFDYSKTSIYVLNWSKMVVLIAKIWISIDLHVKWFNWSMTFPKKAKICQAFRLIHVKFPISTYYM